MSKCVSDLDWERYHAEEMPPVEAASLESHLSQCEACARRREEFVREDEDMLRELRVIRQAARELVIPDSEPPLPRHEAPQARSFGLQIEGYDILSEIHRGG